MTSIGASVSLNPNRKDIILLDGQSLDVETLVSLSSGEFNINLTEESWQKVKEGRAVMIDTGVREVAYGINTDLTVFESCS